LSIVVIADVALLGAQGPWHSAMVPPPPKDGSVQMVCVGDIISLIMVWLAGRWRSCWLTSCILWHIKRMTAETRSPCS